MRLAVCVGIVHGIVLYRLVVLQQMKQASQWINELVTKVASAGNLDP
jgi:hypothetical protein